MSINKPYNIRIPIVIVPLIIYYACELIYPVVSFVSTPTFADGFCNVLIVLTLAFAIVTHYRRVKIGAWILACFCLLAFIVTGWVYPEYRELIYNEYNIWNSVFSPRSGIVLMLVLTLIKDPEDIYEALKLSAVFVWLAYTIRSLSGVGLSAISGSNHAYGYAFLFVSLVYFISYLTQRRKLHLGIALISLLQIVLYASRTAILSFVVFVALYLLFYDNDKKLRWKKRLLIVLGVLLAFTVTSAPFIKMLSQFATQLGWSSRILDSFLTGDFQLDGGRERSYLLAATLLKEHPWGLGVFWDRYYCEYTYVHNFFFELVLDFGWLLGGAVLLLITWNIISILRSNNKGWKALLMLYFSLSMIRLMLSYSFWLDENFWGMVAIIMGYNYSNKLTKKGMRNKKYGTQRYTTR